MRHGWMVLIVGCLLASSVGAQQSPLEARYSHIQDLNNESWNLLSAQPMDPDKLHKAEALLQESLADSAKLKAEVNRPLALDIDGRQWDAQFRLAKIYACLGDREQALTALEGMLQMTWIRSGDTKQIEGEQAFDALRDEPRYRAVMAAFQRLGARWKAPAIAASSGEVSEAQRIAGLSLYWSEARYNFVHFDHVPGLDWNQAYLDFLPRVMAAKNLHDYYDVMMQFAPLLHDGHSDIDPPDSIAGEFYARPPVRTAKIEGHVLVTQILSPVLKSTLHVGDEVLAIDGIDVNAYATERVAPYVSSSTPQDAAVRMYDYQLLMGDHRHAVTLTLRNAAGRQQSVQLSREKDPQAVRAASFEWKMLPGHVAYLAVNEFADDAGLKAFEKALPAILNAKGLIIDVRENGGGSTFYGQLILSYLSDQPIPRPMQRSFDYVPVARAWNGPYQQWKSLGDGAAFERKHDRRYQGPVVVLAGPRTFSAGEDFVMMFDAMKRGTLIGEPTGGSTGQPLTFALPGGGSARVCAKDDRYPDGREFVGKGIQPQITVAPAVADIRIGRDPVMERAEAVLAGKASQAATPAP